MARCITCGCTLHPERAKKYSYCMARECQEKNARGLTMVAVGMNKAAEEFLILDDDTRQDLASGKYRDQRRGSFGTSAAAPAAPSDPAAPGATSPTAPGAGQPVRPWPAAAPQTAAGSAGQAPGSRRAAGREVPPAPRRVARPAWTRSQEKLALLYNEQGLRPAEIAAKLGVSQHLATQIILAARNRGKA